MTTVGDIMARGRDEINIFADDEDSFAFLRLIERAVSKTDLRCYARVLMPNHCHLVVRRGDQSPPPWRRNAPQL
jgi:hypothetical protein